MSRILDRATGGISMMPERERPISEEFRLVAKAWVDAESAASLLEKTKDANFSRLVQQQPSDLKVNQKEHNVLASDEWLGELRRINDARKEANLRKVQKEYVQMRFSEWQAADANQRNERKMSR